MKLHSLVSARRAERERERERRIASSSVKKERRGNILREGTGSLSGVKRKKRKKGKKEEKKTRVNAYIRDTMACMPLI